MSSALRIVGPSGSVSEGTGLSKITETLADLVRRTRIEKGLSLKDVERQSARGGRKIAAGYVSRIENGLVKQVSPDRLLALARGLGVPDDELWARVSGKKRSDRDEEQEQRLLFLFRELPAEKRSDFVLMLEALQAGGSRGKRRTA